MIAHRDKIRARDLHELVACQFASGCQLSASPRRVGLCNQASNKVDWVAVFQAEWGFSKSSEQCESMLSCAYSV